MSWLPPDDVASGFGQQLHDVELARRKLDDRTGACQPTPAGVELEVAHGEDGARLALSWLRAQPAPELGPDPRQELAMAEWLGDVVVGAGVEPDDLVRLLPPRGQHDDRHGRAGAEPARYLDAVQVRQRHVEHDRVWRWARADRGQRLRAGHGQLDRVPLLAEEERERLRLERVVLDQHQSTGRLVLIEGRRRGRHAPFTRFSYDLHESFTRPRLKEARVGRIRTCRQGGAGGGRFSGLSGVFKTAFTFRARVVVDNVCGRGAKPSSSRIGAEVNASNSPKLRCRSG